jgi:hypothetical protein
VYSIPGIVQQRLRPALSPPQGIAVKGERVSAHLCAHPAQKAHHPQRPAVVCWFPCAGCRFNTRPNHLQKGILPVHRQRIGQKGPVYALTVRVSRRRGWSAALVRFQCTSTDSDERVHGHWYPCVVCSGGGS